MAEPHAQHPPTVEELIARLRSPDPSVRLHAAAGLASRGDKTKAAVAALADLVHDECVHVRKVAALSLGDVAAAGNGDEAVAALVLALRDENDGVRRRAAIALGELGPQARQAVPALFKALQDPKDGVRRMAAQALSAIQGDTRSQAA